MENCCCNLGLLNKIGPLISEIHDENSRVIATCVLMALLNHVGNNFSDYLVDVKVEGNNLVFTWKDGTTKEIPLPLNTDDYVDSGNINGNNLVLHRKSGTNITVSLLNFVPPEVDLSPYFKSCTLSGKDIIFYNKDGQEKGRVTLKDGMLDSVEFNTNTRKLIFKWNLDANKLDYEVTIPDTYVTEGQLKSPDDNHEHFRINLKRNSLSDINIDLLNLESWISEKIEIKPIGYYWSSALPEADNTILLQYIEYIGTDLRDLKPDNFAKHRYILYTTNGNTFTVVDEFKEPPLNKYILFSSYTTSFGRADAIAAPTAFVYLTFMNDNLTKYNAYRLGLVSVQNRKMGEYITIDSDSNDRHLVFTPNESAQTNGISSSILSESAYSDLIKSMFIRTGLFNVTTSGNSYTVALIGSNNFKLHVFYSKFEEFNPLTYNYPSNCKLFEYTTSEHEVVDNPNGDSSVKAIALLKAKLCNFVNTSNRIDIGDETLPNMSYRANTLFTVDKDVVDLTNGVINDDQDNKGIKLIVKSGTTYYIIVGFLVINDGNPITVTRTVDGESKSFLIDKGRTVPFDTYNNMNAGDNSYVYIAILKDYAPANAISNYDFYRDIKSFRISVGASNFQVYKKVYGSGTSNGVSYTKPEVIRWEALKSSDANITINDFFDLSIINQDNVEDWSFKFLNFENWGTVDTTNLTVLANRNSMNFAWSILLGSILSSTNRNGQLVEPLNSYYYKDTLGWGNRYSLYSLGTTGYGNIKITIDITNLAYDSTEKILNCKGTVIFEIETTDGIITGWLEATIGTYDYYKNGGFVYNFAVGPNLADSYSKFERVYPKVTVTSLSGTARKLNSADIYKISLASS